MWIWIVNMYFIDFPVFKNEYEVVQILINLNVSFILLWISMMKRLKYFTMQEVGSKINDWVRLIIIEKLYIQHNRCWKSVFYAFWNLKFPGFSNESLKITSYMGACENIKCVLKMLRLESRYKNSSLGYIIFLNFFLKNCFFSRSMESSKDLNSATKYIIYIHVNYNKYIAFLPLHS